jgi:ATP-dependent Clp protease ATP-binding subunit ClpC
MFDRFTARGSQVVRLAQDEADALNHELIGTEHVLLGLLRTEGGIAARVLGELGIKAGRVREQVVEIVGPGEYYRTPREFTPAAERVFEQALAEGLELGGHYVDTEQLLMALMRVNDVATSQILREANVDIDEVRTRVARILDALPRWSPPSA